MNTNKIVTEELREVINEIRDSLFKGLSNSLNELDVFFNNHVKLGRIDPGYESQYEELLDRFRKQLDEFCKISKSITNI